MGARLYPSAAVLLLASAIACEPARVAPRLGHLHLAVIVVIDVDVAGATPPWPWVVSIPTVTVSARPKRLTRVPTHWHG